MRHKATDITTAPEWKYSPLRPAVGLDIGTRGAKGVLLREDEVFTAIIPTGHHAQATADALLAVLLGEAGLSRADLGHIVGTGHGRVSLRYEEVAYKVVTETSCHAMGAHAALPGTRTVIDIGGQDSRAIKVDPITGKVVEFVVNDKSEAGTGRFLEKTATLLGIELEGLGAVAAGAKNPAAVSGQYGVFGETEVISLRAHGERDNDPEARANIAAGVHYSAARRVNNLVGRIGIVPGLAFTGGVSNNTGMRGILETLLNAKFQKPKADLIYAGALGAAIYAARAFAQLAAPSTAANL
ncbi:MAG: acyl-CoA dehydratase activase [Puniceicoccales bacterium]|jgi:predicted CoA-substrate-specific enzyme activase|nr:acyl-CoA dehydratase activase [Puniceicoccales bacterium]